MQFCYIYYKTLYIIIYKNKCVHSLILSSKTVLEIFGFKVQKRDDFFREVFPFMKFQKVGTKSLMCFSREKLNKGVVGGLMIWNFQDY